MTIEIKKNAAETVIEVAGRLDTTTAPVLDKTINEDIEGTKNLILDIKNLEYISSEGRFYEGNQCVRRGHGSF